MKVILIVLLLTIPLNLLAAESSGFSRAATGIWASRQKLTIPSPDGTKAVVVLPPKKKSHEWQHIVFVRVKGRDFRTRFGGLVNAEVRWADDSNAFFLTYSGGGNVGTYHVEVVYVGESGFKEVEPVPDGRVLSVPRCFEKEWPNVVGIKWLNRDSSRLLIAVEVPPHSSCASMGTFEAFEITIPRGRVKARYDQLKAKELFRDEMGPELMNADDDCVRSPNDCVPPGLEIKP